jgi:uroporphyrinogen III methyltransferase/synthase
MTAASDSPGTVVLYMATHRLAENLARLIAGGRSAGTPAAYIACATHREQRVILGTLSTLAAQVSGQEGAGPALVIVGDVVRLRRKIAWLERRPLAGRQVIVARARPGESQIARELRGLGAIVTEAPHVEVAPLGDHSELDAAIAALPAYGAVVFACEAGVDAVVDRLATLGLPPGTLSAVPLVTVGPGATERMRAHRLTPRIAARGSCADELARHAPRLRLGPVLVVTADGGRPGLLADLTALQVDVRSLVAYRLAHRPAALPGLVDAVVLPGSTAAQSLLGDRANGSLLAVPMVAMGPRTLEAAQRLGARQVTRAASDTPPSLVAATIALLAPQAAQRSIRSSSALPASGRPERPA